MHLCHGLLLSSEVRNELFMLMVLKGIMLNEKKTSPKVAYCMIPFI